MDSKRRRVVSYENMDDALRKAFEEKYPRGFNDYLPELVKYEKPDGTPFYAVTIETEDSIALVKIKVQIDDTEDLERWLDSESGIDGGDTGESDDDNLPDDNISQYQNAEEDPADSE